MATKDTVELYGRVSALEAILMNLAWRFAQSHGDDLMQAVAVVMMNAEANLTDASQRAVGAEQRKIAAAATESFRHLSEALMRNLNKTAPEGTGH